MRATWSLVHKPINHFSPLVECILAFGGGGGEPFVHAVFRPFSLSKWKHEIVLSRREASVMLNLFQHLANMKEELPAKKIFTPKHLVSLACNLFTNKILNQVQDDITKNPRKNFPFFNTSEKGGDKSLCIQSWHLNTSVKERYKKCLA